MEWRVAFASKAVRFRRNSEYYALDTGTTSTGKWGRSSVMHSDRCDLTIPGVEPLQHILPLTTIDTLETMWMNWLLTVPGMSTRPCAST